MAALRAFLLIRNSVGEWNVTVHRQFDELLSTWEKRPDAEAATGIFHVGFERPPSHAFDELSAKHPGRALVTGSARYVLPPGFTTSLAPAGYVGDLPVFLATTGWGYALKDIVPPPADEVARPAHIKPSGWVRQFTDDNPDMTDALALAGIYNEHTYLTHEASLETPLRIRCGIFRLESRIGTNTDDPCAFAAVAPPWLLERPLNSLELTVRLTNVFQGLGMKTVRELSETSLKTLLRTQNFGLRSAKDLLLALRRGLEEGPTYGAQQLAEDGLTFWGSIEQQLVECDSREKDIVLRRMGLFGRSETLQEIGVTYGVTRERIRQIEAKILKRLFTKIDWPALFSHKLERLLTGRESPMPVLGIEAVDPWFTGMGRYHGAFRYALETICEGSTASIVTIGSVDYVAFMTQDRWVAAVRDARRLMEATAGEGSTEEYCRQLVGALLPARASEFKELLWAEAVRYCHFVPDQTGVHVLSTYGRGVEAIVEAVLEESPTPLHYTAIASRASGRAGRELDTRQVHNAASNVGLLFSLGTYGLDKHLSLSGDALEQLAAEAEELVAEGVLGRQWHASELLLDLLERGSEVASHADKYVLDIALQKSRVLTRLGRLVWKSGTETDDARIDVRQAIISVLQKAGKPLRLLDIKQRIVALRGINEHFQVFAVDPLLKVAPGYWGLNDRDFPIKRPDQANFVERLISALETRGRGIHVSEFDVELKNIAPREMSAVAVCSIALLNPRIRSSSSRYLYLASWGSARRESILEAIDTVLANATHPLALDEIASLVEKRIERACGRNTISSSLQDLGAILDPVTKQWSKRPSGTAREAEGEDVEEP